MTQPRPPRTGTVLLDAVAVMDRLRSPGGCPWDAAQTHASLAPYAIEEAHEVADAAESGDEAALAEELGDLLLQVLFHARVASERKRPTPEQDPNDPTQDPDGAAQDASGAGQRGAGSLHGRDDARPDLDHAAQTRADPRQHPDQHPDGTLPDQVDAPQPQGGHTSGFDIDDVAHGLIAKLIRRHPHVFADSDAATPEAVNAQWDEIKQTEKRREHVLDDIPVSLPALARAQKVVSRLRKAGTPPSGTEIERAGRGMPHEGSGATPADAAVTGHGPDPSPASARIASALLALVVEADAAGVDAEAALRSAVRALEAARRGQP